MWRQVGRFFGVLGVFSITSATQAQTAPAPLPTTATTFAVPAPPPPAPTASSVECFPHCRSGYTCYQAQCVSLCNPPCGAGESCTSAGECTPTATLAVPAAPSVAPAPAPVSSRTPEPATCSAEPSALRPPGTFVFAAHVGIQMFGEGHTEQTFCERGMCDSAQNLDFNDKSRFVLGLDGMFHASSGLRLGLGYWLVPRSAIGSEPNKAITRHLGSEHELNAIVEGIAALKPNLALALRAQGGPRMLITGGDLASSTDSFLAACSDMPVDHCEGDKGPHFGGQFTAMIGLIFGSKVRGRVDLAAERYFVGNGKRMITDDGQTSSSETDMFGTRLWLLGGLEL